MFATMRVLLLATILCALGAVPAQADKLMLVAGTGSSAERVPATEAKLDGPFAIDFDRSGSAFVAEMTGQRVLRIDPQGILTRFAGTGEQGNTGDGGPALAAQFNGMHSLAVSAQGDVYVADTWNNRVRKIDARTGEISAFAGTGQKGFSGDGGPAAEAEFGGVYCLAFGPGERQLYVADLDNRRIRTIDLESGVVTTVAGNGERGVPHDGADARSAPLVDPRAVTVDREGNVYILERSGHALRRVDTAGSIRTVAGTGEHGMRGDGGDALKTQLNGPKHLCMDLDGSVLIADTENHLVRRYLPEQGRIERVAGTGHKGSAGLGGPPEQAELSQPHGVYVHADGTMYIVDSSNHRVLKIERATTSRR